MTSLKCAAIALLAIQLEAQQAPATQDAAAIFERTKAATVIILAGEGTGRLRSIAPAS
jgi:hypothetical protein